MDLLTRKCELVRLSFEVNDISLGSMSCRVILKRMFRELNWFIYSIRVPKTNKIQKDTRVFQSIDVNLSKTGGCHKLT